MENINNMKDTLVISQLLNEFVQSKGIELESNQLIEAKYDIDGKLHIKNDLFELYVTYFNAYLDGIKITDELTKYGQELFDEYVSELFSCAEILLGRKEKELEIIPDEVLEGMVTIVVTDQEPGEKCNDGGEYGFYTHYKPTLVKGLYRIYTTTTCDFDSCGTGFEEYRFISEEDIENL